MGKIIFITGITGQDGSYLAEYFLSKGYEVHGIIRRASTFNTERIDHLYADPHDTERNLILHYGDLLDFSSLTALIKEIEPDQVYNLGAQSHVKVSFNLPIYTGSVTALGTACILEAIRRSDLNIRFYQASSSEMFGSSPPPQNEETPFHPKSPYACAKMYAHWMTVNYRDAYGLFACNGILFNHESPRRGPRFVTRKITRALASIITGKQEFLYLGNLDAKRDWGYAPEYIVAMVQMLEQSSPDDYVLGTGESYSVRDFLDCCGEYLKLDWEKYVKIDKRYFRPAEVDHLQADSSKAQKVLNWRTQVKISDLCKIMLDHDLKCQNHEQVPNDSQQILNKVNLNWFIEPLI
ncbi:MAG: GDP-mannose 4,6-dehydratase [Promethearchaeota archaeon]